MEGTEGSGVTVGKGRGARAVPIHIVMAGLAENAT